MAEEATKQVHQDPNQNQSGRENDPTKKRTTPDQYNEQQSNEQGAGKHTGQTGHENPRTGSEQQGGQRQGGQQGNPGSQQGQKGNNNPEQHGGQHQPQGGQQGNPGTQPGQKGNNPEHQGSQRPGHQGGSERTPERGEGNNGGQDRVRNKSNETDERSAKQGQGQKR